MSNAKNRSVQHFLQTVLRTDAAHLSDGQLLERYIRQREEAAFAALVRRHGPMVMSVCRRVLGKDHDAEDAFQATFLVLVRKASSILPRDMLANWLYGVARTTALRARSLNAKRQGREKQVVQLPEPETKPRNPWNDVQTLLDEELGRLPDKYRVPIVLCDLQDQTIKEAARRLGWPQGTLAGRLARARKMLANRLSRRELAVSAGLLASAFAQKEVSATVPMRMMSSTIEAAKSFAAGQAVSNLISVQAATLTEGVLRTMLLTKLKTAAAVLAAMTAIALSTAAAFYPAAASDEPQKQTQTPASEKKPSRLTIDITANTASSSKPRPDTKTGQERVAETSSSESSYKSPLPSAPMPQQALVSLRKDLLVVRTMTVMYEPITMATPKGDRFTSYAKSELLKTTCYEKDSIKVYDVHGKRIDKNRLGELLRKETVALVSTNEEAADPLMLRLFKEGTLLFILPMSIAPGSAYGAVITPSPAATEPPAVRRQPGSVPAYAPPTSADKP